MVTRWLIRVLGGIPKIDLKKSALEKEAQILHLSKQLIEKEAAILGYERRARKNISVIDAGVEDPAPSEDATRYEYAISVSNFYKDILEKKLRHMIALVREQQDMIYAEVPQGMTRSEYDNFLRGTSNAFRLLMDWGELMSGEVSRIELENNVT